MIKARSQRPWAVALVLATSAAIVLLAAHHLTASASADNPSLTGDFSTFNGSMFCMTITGNGVVYGTPNRADLALKPGSYSLTANDTSTGHDFTLRSCPGSVVTCTSLNPVATTAVITTRANTGTVTDTID